MISIKCGRYTLNFKKKVIMGILNVTPDSFSEHGLFLDAEKAVGHAKEMVREGAGIIDIGGESSRPGCEPISEEEELKRVKPVVERLVDEIDVPLSIDTYKAGVAEECLKAGADMLNDITGLRNRDMIKVAARYNAPVVVMHMLGTPKTMQENPCYKDVVKEVRDFLNERIKEAKKGGVKDIIIDPGIGFGKRAEHNIQLIKRLSEFKTLGCPILIGVSRKSFIGNILNIKEPEKRLIGTIVSNLIAAENGADILRVHDVREMREALEMYDNYKSL